ncbi:hypothetical protein PPERSA_05468 [Pseudocohnilembus persalinus]|uniref:Serine aminopeptidase S33 domain-containing protein n=1 Tax=Pseudocohnilembus persalinus TaxID=266149 RepID=A0A0V0R8W5_PSEPJ|nr:hypothetical protein PPERSA_05468 [Pseudocohnilembus persalinus]|eukprot:KRX10648.1 hypothetical protein PPERSA_05468 [Pseudocohnilembus persalinus]
MSLFQNYDSLHEIFIRPPRSEYSLYDLGPKKAQYGNYIMKRHDFTLKNKHDLQMECSFFEPIEQKDLQFDEAQKQFPCVVYSHCNSGSKLEGVPLIKALGQYGIGIFLLDFTGSGLSQGQYITLGWRESDDLQVVIDYLKNCGKVSKLALWGRSMGAVTNLLFAEKNNSEDIQCMIVDSPFINLREVALDYANQKTNLIPNFVIDMVLNNIRKKILDIIDLDIDNLCLKQKATKIKIPVMFVCSKEDAFINWKQTQQLHDLYGTNYKQIYLVEGDHNAQRQQQFIQDGAKFMAKNLMQMNFDENKLFLNKNSPNNTNSNTLRKDSTSTNDGASLPSEQNTARQKIQQAQQDSTSQIPPVFRSNVNEKSKTPEKRTTSYVINSKNNQNQHEKPKNFKQNYVQTKQISLNSPDKNANGEHRHNQNQNQNQNTSFFKKQNTQILPNNDGNNYNKDKHSQSVDKNLNSIVQPRKSTFCEQNTFQGQKNSQKSLQQIQNKQSHKNSSFYNPSEHQASLQQKNFNQKLENNDFSKMMGGQHYKTHAPKDKDELPLSKNNIKEWQKNIQQNFPCAKLENQQQQQQTKQNQNLNQNQNQNQNQSQIQNQNQSSQQNNIEQNLQYYLSNPVYPRQMHKMQTQIYNKNSSNNDSQNTNKSYSNFGNFNQQSKLKQSSSLGTTLAKFININQGYYSHKQQQQQNQNSPYNQNQSQNAQEQNQDSQSNTLTMPQFAKSSKDSNKGQQVTPEQNGENSTQNKSQKNQNIDNNYINTNTNQFSIFQENNPKAFKTFGNLSNNDSNQTEFQQQNQSSNSNSNLNINLNQNSNSQNDFIKHRNSYDPEKILQIESQDSSFSRNTDYNKFFKTQDPLTPNNNNNKNNYNINNINNNNLKPFIGKPQSQYVPSVQLNLNKTQNSNNNNQLNARSSHSSNASQNQKQPDYLQIQQKYKIATNQFSQNIQQNSLSNIGNINNFDSINTQKQNKNQMDNSNKNSTKNQLNKYRQFGNLQLNTNEQTFSSQYNSIVNNQQSLSNTSPLQSQQNLSKQQNFPQNSYNNNIQESLGNISPMKENEKMSFNQIQQNKSKQQTWNEVQVPQFSPERLQQYENQFQKDFKISIQNIQEDLDPQQQQQQQIIGENSENCFSTQNFINVEKHVEQFPVHNLRDHNSNSQIQKVPNSMDYFNQDSKSVNPSFVLQNQKQFSQNTINSIDEGQEIAFDKNKASQKIAKLNLKQMQNQHNNNNSLQKQPQQDTYQIQSKNQPHQQENIFNKTPQKSSLHRPEQNKNSNQISNLCTKNSSDMEISPEKKIFFSHFNEKTQNTDKNSNQNEENMFQKYNSSGTNNEIGNLNQNQNYNYNHLQTKFQNTNLQKSVNLDHYQIETQEQARFSTPSFHPRSGYFQNKDGNNNNKNDKNFNQNNNENAMKNRDTLNKSNYQIDQISESEPKDEQQDIQTLNQYQIFNSYNNNNARINSQNSNNLANQSNQSLNSLQNNYNQNMMNQSYENSLLINRLSASLENDKIGQYINDDIIEENPQKMQTTKQKYSLNQINQFASANNNIQQQQNQIQNINNNCNKQAIQGQILPKTQHLQYQKFTQQQQNQLAYQKSMLEDKDQQININKQKRLNQSSITPQQYQAFNYNSEPSQNKNQNDGQGNFIQQLQQQSQQQQLQDKQNQKSDSQKKKLKYSCNPTTFKNQFDLSQQRGSLPNTFAQNESQQQKILNQQKQSPSQNGFQNQQNNKNFSTKNLMVNLVDQQQYLQQQGKQKQNQIQNLKNQLNSKSPKNDKYPQLNQN